MGGAAIRAQGETHIGARSDGLGGRRLDSACGQVTVLFALLLVLLLMLGSIVIDIGSWYTHARHLQTKVDAAAFAGGGAWGFPCGPDVDARIEAEARAYFGPHSAADGTVVADGHNPQVGGVGADHVYLALNQTDWWDDAFPATDFSSPSGAICASQVLDVKGTEADSPLLWGMIPFFPDIKRKARIEIQEPGGLTGLLPIAVRLPQPRTAAAVFYDESSGSVLDVKYFREVCTPTVADCILGALPGVGQWTTEPPLDDADGSLATFNVAPKTGVVLATSFRPACGPAIPPAEAPCLEDGGWLGQPVDSFCRQSGGAVKCYDGDGSGATQTVRSGLHFLRGYGNADTGTGPPQIRSASLESASAGCGSYFNSSPSACSARLRVTIDLGALLGKYPPPAGSTAPLKASDVEVRYRLVRADGTSSCTYNAQCDVLPTNGDATGVVTFSTTGDPSSPHLPIVPESRGNAVALQIRLRNSANASDPDCGGEFTDLCRWFYTADTLSESVPPTDAEILAAPIQRSFMGGLERTGPAKWLRLTKDQDCDHTTKSDRIVGANPVTGEDAASQPAGALRCYIVDLGLAGGLARDQDEPPIAFNLGDNSSQRAYIDCDDTIANLKSEIVTGCQKPAYAANRFNTDPTCPGSNGFFTTVKPPPFENWPPFRCVLTQTGNSGQVIQGFNERIFGQSNNPKCQVDASEYVRGRNYWHRLNNDYDAETFAWDGTGTGPGDSDGNPKGNTLRSDDPRLVTLFFTGYDSFTDTGNEVYPIVGFGKFYVTGYGETINGGWKGGKPEDPCNEGNGLAPAAGNTPPPDIDMSRNTRWVWGHFVKDVVPSGQTTGGSGELCDPTSSFDPCVAILVE
jgi:hypothetical protein